MTKCIYTGEREKEKLAWSEVRSKGLEVQVWVSERVESWCLFAVVNGVMGLMISMT